MSEQKNTILYVDDEEDNLVTFKSVFRREYKVIIANSGQEALELLKQNTVDLVISDQRMPMMTGVQLLQIVTQEYPEIKRMILSGHSDMDDIINAINVSKIHAYVSKPWNKDGLIATINNVLNEPEEMESLKLQLKQLEQENLNLKKKLNNVKS